jgi:hypothetical protein
MQFFEKKMGVHLHTDAPWWIRPWPQGKEQSAVERGGGLPNAVERGVESSSGGAAKKVGHAGKKNSHQAFYTE